MTNKDALQSILPFEASESFIEKALIDSGLSGDTLYSTQSKRAVDLCLAEMITTKLAEPDFSEEGFSKTASRGALLQLRYDILVRYNMSTGGITDVSDLW